MHLLVVEDDPRLGRLLVRLLSEDRHVDELACTGRDGLEAADSGASLDAIVLDVGLPDIDGLEVAHRIRSRASRTPIIILTARDGLPDRIAGLDAGADDYLNKTLRVPKSWQPGCGRARPTFRHHRQARRGSPYERPDRPRRDPPPGDRGWSTPSS